MNSLQPIALFILVWIISVPTSPAAAQKVGDRVLVTVNYDTKIKAEKVGKVAAGQIKTITAINESWCAVDGVQGWLPLRYAMELPKALKIYSERVAARPNDPEALTTRGLIHFELGQYQQAYNDFTQALRVNPRLFIPWNNRAMVSMVTGRWNEALKDATRAVELNPRYPEALVNRALILAAIGKFDDAIIDMNKVIEIEPENAMHFVGRGSIHFDRGQLDAAWADYEKAAAMQPRLPDIYLGMGNVLLGQGKIEEAIASAQKAIELRPNFAKAYNLLGWLYIESRKFDEAIAQFDRAIRLDPFLAIAYSNRGVALVELQRVPEAIKDYNRALEMDKNAPLTYCNRAAAWMIQGEFEKARADFEASLKIAPDLPETLNVYAWFLSTCVNDAFRDGKRAKEMAEKAVASSPEFQWYRVDTLAAALAEVGEFDKAVELQTQVAEKAPADKQSACRERLEQYRSHQPTRSELGKTAAPQGQMP